MIPTWAIRTEADKRAIADGCWWDERRAAEIIKFAGTIFRPVTSDRPIQLLEWQTRFIQSLVAWRTRDGFRRWKFANLHISKQNGKSTLAALLSAYELLCSEEVAPLVVAGAVSQKQATYIYDDVAHTLTANGFAPQFAKLVEYQKRIDIKGTRGRFLALASDGDTAQGLRVNFQCLDELHAHKSSKLFDSLRYATISKKSGCTLAISTAGDDPTHFYSQEIYSKSKRILSGEDLDPTWYAEVYESAPDSDPLDPAEWRKANPSLGCTFTEDDFKRDLETARNSDPVAWFRFLRYRLNRFIRSDSFAYYCVNDFDRGNPTPEPEDLGRLDCTIGVDLSLTTSPSSAVAVWELPNGERFVKGWAWVAREGVKLRERTSLPKYEEFEQQGWMTVTDGDMIDHALILQHLTDLCRTNRVRRVIFDPTSAVVMMNRLADDTGADVRRMPQTYRYFSAPMQALFLAIKQGQIKHDRNNWLRYCLGNVRLEENKTTGEIRPSVKRSTDHIDGAIALLLAYSDIMAPETEQSGPGIGWAKTT